MRVGFKASAWEYAAAPARCGASALQALHRHRSSVRAHRAAQRDPAPVLQQGALTNPGHVTLTLHARLLGWGPQARPQPAAAVSSVPATPSRGAAAAAGAGGGGAPAPRGAPARRGGAPAPPPPPPEGAPRTDTLSCKRAAAPPRAPVVLVSAGSFNPPTHMHLRMCEVAAHELGQVRRGPLVLRRLRPEPANKNASVKPVCSCF